MPPKRPIELVNASKACAEAWQRRNDMIEAGDWIGVQVMNSACGILDARYNTLYQEWQILGGTSDIDSIAHPFIDYEHADWLDEQATRESVRP
jgi:hypothetical protein